MKKFLLLSVYLLIILYGCGSIMDISKATGVKEESLKTIPYGANTIYVARQGISADSLYEEVFAALISRGHRISNGDKPRHYLMTEGKDVGLSTLQRMTLVISDKGPALVITIRSEWKAGTEASLMASGISGISYIADWAKSKWEISRLGVAFAEGYAIAQLIEGAEISYDINR